MRNLTQSFDGHLRHEYSEEAAWGQSLKGQQNCNLDSGGHISLAAITRPAHHAGLHALPSWAKTIIPMWP